MRFSKKRKKKKKGQNYEALFSSVGGAGVPCTEALSSLQQPWV